MRACILLHPTVDAIFCMPYSPKPTPLNSFRSRRFIVLVCAGLFLATNLAYAQVPGPADPQKNTQRQRASALKFAGFRLLRDSLARSLEKNFPEDTRVSFYLDVDVKTFVLQRAVLYIDDQEPITRNYSSREAGALLRSSEHRVLRSNFQPGRHHLRIEYTGQKRGAKADDPTLHGSIQLDFDAKPKLQAFVLPVVPKALAPITSFFGTSRPKSWEWENEVEDPRLGLVRFLRDVDLNFEAMQELLEIAGPNDDPAPLPAGYDILLTHSYIDYGMRDLAATTARRAGKEYKNDKLVQTPGQSLADAWIRIAELDYRRGDYARATYTLDNIKQKLSPAQRLYMQDVRSRILLAQGQYPQAEKVLARANASLDKQDDDLYLPYLQTLYVRYNYAFALIKGGRGAEGRTLLERVGATATPNQAERAVRDLANLDLAYQFLRAKQGATAKPYFQRVSLHGTYSNDALLGLGWTELAPDGAKQERASPGTYGGGLFLGKFEQAKISSDKTQQLKRALVPWQELVKRNPEAPAVQEALLSVPYALEKLGLHEQAHSAYERALSIYQTTQRRLESNAQALSQGLNTTALFVQYNSSGIPKTRSMERLITGHQFQEYLDNYKTFQVLEGALLRTGNRQATLLDKALAYAAVSQARDAQALVAAEIEKDLKRIRQYKDAAIRGVARYYDWAATNNNDQPTEPDTQPATETGSKP